VGYIALKQFQALFPEGRCACGCRPSHHEIDGATIKCKCIRHPGLVCGRVINAGVYSRMLMEWAGKQL
jgi:hypothetical protein